MEKKTPLYDAHLALSGKMVPYAGYLMPVQYPGGVIEEHLAVRKKAGLFDVSHMGEVFLEGPDALLNLNHLMCNDFTNMADGQVRYSPMLNDRGGIVDDLIVYRFNGEKYMVVINAANREKDIEWMKAHLAGDVVFSDRSEALCELAIQGPEAGAIVAALCEAAHIPKKYYTFVAEANVAGVPCVLSRTGYTGERGFELYAAAERAEELWTALIKAGAEKGLIPCGLGSRDTLRLEAGMPLYGHEMDEDISPLETGLHWAVKLDKPDFIGKSALLDRDATRTRVGLKVVGKGIAREGQAVYIGEEKIGETTSGTHLPYLAGAYAMALVNRERAETGAAVEIDVRGRKVAAEIVPLPFYKRG